MGKGKEGGGRKGRRRREGEGRLAYRLFLGPGVFNISRPIDPISSARWPVHVHVYPSAQGTRIVSTHGKQ